MPNMMMRRKIASSDPLTPTRIMPVEVAGRGVQKIAIQVQNDDGDWECVSIHGPNYRLIENRHVAEVTEELFSRTGLSWDSASEIWTGKYWAKLYRSDVSMEAPKVGDALALGLRIENSYDGSCQFRLVLMAYVLSCSNGLVSPRCFSAYRMRHTRSHDFSITEAVEVIQSGMDEVMGIVPMVERLSDIPLTVELLSQVARDTELPNGEWGHIARELSNARSAWDLMQAITHRLTHHGRGRSSLQHQERVGDYFLHRLAG